MIFFKPKTKLLLALEISTSGVKGALFWSHKDAKPEVARVFRSNEKLLPEVNFIKLQKNIHSALLDILKQVHASVQQKVDGVFISLSSPWYYSQTKVINIKHREPFELNQEFLDNILSKEESGIKKKSEERFKITAKDLAVLEKVPMKSFLNGYGVKNIFNKKINQAELYVYLSVVLEKMVDDIKDLVKERIGVDVVHIHTSPLVTFFMLEGMADYEAGFLLVDVKEEITDVVLVQRGFIRESVSFSRGSNFVIRRIASVFKVSPEEALSYLKIYGSNKTDAKTADILKETIEEAASEWGLFFEKTLKHFHTTAPVPVDVFMMGYGNLIDVFAKEVGSAEFATFSSRSTPLSVHKLSSDFLKDKYKFGENLKDHQDVGILFLMLFFNQHVWEKEY